MKAPIALIILLGAALLAGGAHADTATVGGLPLVRIVKQVNATVSNTGLSTTNEINLASIPLPSLGANDAIELSVLWSTAGTATDSKVLSIRLATAACTPLNNSTCNSGTQLLAETFNTSSLIGAQTLTLMRNAGATNSQVFYGSGCGATFGSCSVVPGTAAIETGSATAYLNVNCTTSTSTADTCAIKGYTVKLLQGN